MSNRLGKCLCLVAALGVLDGHLMLAQTWAWITMLQERSTSQSVSEALDSTFSGDAPCPMCCAVQKERQKQEEKAPLPELKPSAKFPPAMFTRHVRPDSGGRLHIGLPLCAPPRLLIRYESPAVPPPRHAV